MALKVAICGGGIGGLTTALCIDRLCGDNVALEIFEQAPEYKVSQTILEVKYTDVEGNWRGDRIRSKCCESNAINWPG